MKKNLFALLNICTILLSLFLTGCSGKESKITLNSSQPECILSNNDNIVLESYTNESVLDDEIPERSITCWGDSMMQGAGCNEAYIYSDNGIEDISYFTTPSALQYFTSINTYNFGVGGENSYQISLRAGGIPIYTDRDIYITDHSLAYVKFVDENEEKEAEKPGIVIARKVTITNKQNFFGVGKIGKIFKKDNEDKIANLKTIFTKGKEERE